MQRPPTTAMLLARRALLKRPGRDVVDWAIVQLEQGYDTDHLRQLASMSGMENDFELEEIFDRAVNELGLKNLDGTVAVLAFAKELAREYLDGIVTRDHLLVELCGICIDLGYLDSLHPFYLLRWTNDDLRTEGFSFYRPDATRNNIEELVRIEAQKLLATEFSQTRI